MAQGNALAAKIGSALGQGLAGASQGYFGGKLEALADERADRLGKAQRAQKRSIFENLGATPQEAEFLIDLPPQSQLEFVSNLGSRSQQAQQPSGLETLQQTQQQTQEQGPDQQPEITPDQIPEILEQLKGADQGTQDALAQLMNQQQRGQLGRAQLGIQQPKPEAKTAPEQTPQQVAQPSTPLVAPHPAARFGSLGQESKANKLPAKAQDRAYVAIETADQMESIANEMQELLDTGEVDSGVSGKFYPNVLQNEATQQFETLSNELALILASRSGVATNFKIKLAQSMKPNLAQKPETQKALVKRILQTSSELRNNANKLLGKNEIEVGSTVNELPTKGIPVGAEAEDESGKKLRFNGSAWVGV